MQLCIINQYHELIKYDILIALNVWTKSQNMLVYNARARFYVGFATGIG